MKTNKTDDGLNVDLDFSHQWDDDLPVAICEGGLLTGPDGEKWSLESDEIAAIIDVEAAERAEEETMDYSEYLQCRAEWYADLASDR